MVFAYGILGYLLQPCICSFILFAVVWEEFNQSPRFLQGVITFNSSIVTNDIGDGNSVCFPEDS